jgi:class 3 adenylate cyclase
VQPDLRTALHVGKVIAGEVGQVRRAIVFHGNVMNATVRLEQATREVGCLFMVSAQALDCLAPSPQIRTYDPGARQLSYRVLWSRLSATGRSEPADSLIFATTSKHRIRVAGKRTLAIDAIGQKRP